MFMGIVMSVVSIIVYIFSYNVAWTPLVLFGYVGEARARL
jgi:hypothetical protein